ncbi:uncharacterized protein LOC113300357 [Papaver somniferum]|uniref:uncharacterized protein LOC113300357 n=1 Tax=Papaver somniferum TaxID=3469 RepID=UPI000E705B74|nr:uncharacterized protein LOC113300357 [Papaver somniferum]
MQLTGFEEAKEAWDFLAKRYTQVDFAQRYKLEQDIRALEQQPEQTISDFHSEMSIVWNQLALMEPKWTVDVELWQKYREESRLIQLLMALRDKFESVRASILHRNPMTTVESALSELITEETRKRIKPDIPAVLAVSSRPSSNPSFSSQRNFSASTYRDLSQVQCHNCKNYGHLVKNCPSHVNISNSQGNSQRLTMPNSTPSPGTPQCNYSKEFGHIVGNCTSPSSRNMRNKRRFGTTAPSYYSPGHVTAAPSLDQEHDSSNST